MYYKGLRNLKLYSPFLMDYIECRTIQNNIYKLQFVCPYLVIINTYMTHYSYLTLYINV